MATAKVLLSSAACIDCMDCGLVGLKGAQDVIAMISSRLFVTKLILGHNELSDIGCVALFQFLSSSFGRRYKIKEISLNANGIGNEGLLAVSEYLNGNESLKELFLQNNEFTGDPSVIETFTASINNSRLQLLSLTSNRLTNSFVSTFFPSLDSPYLRELHISAIDITRKSIQPIIEFISSRHRCYLQTLKCNGNALGLNGVVSIVEALERSNFSLTNVELYANKLESGHDDSSDTTDSEQESHGTSTVRTWKDIEPRHIRALTRNSYLKKETEKDALQLLKYSRVLLLNPSRRTGEQLRTSAPASSDESSSDFSSNATMSTQTLQKTKPPTSHVEQQNIETSSFHTLPVELQQHILSFMAPTLSTCQRIKIFAFASSYQTLPPINATQRAKASVWSFTSTDLSDSSKPKTKKALNFSAMGSGCIMDPTILQPNMSDLSSLMSGMRLQSPFGPGGPMVSSARSSGFRSSISSGTNMSKCAGGGCNGDYGKCVGASHAFFCNREQQRTSWLDAMGCSSFDPARD